jgi:hypothetical protein
VGPDRPGRRSPLLLGCIVVATLLVAGPLIATWILDQPGSSGADFQAVGFGTGGSECTLTDVASSFKQGVPIRDVLTLSPDLPAGSTVTVKVEMNGAELVDLRDTINFTEPAACIYGTLSGLEVGDYRVEYGITPSTMPPASGTFSVTP